MDERTLAALKGSIAKWEAIVAGTGQDEGAANCPLCALFSHFVNPEAQRGCKGCPVQEETGLSGCDGSPYEECDEDRDDFKEMAAAELAFLKSLLPEAQS